jgi:hypothetical protein
MSYSDGNPANNNPKKGGARLPQIIRIDREYLLMGFHEET